MKRAVCLVLAVLALASLACTISINVPRMQTGETKTFEVNEPLPAGDSANVTLRMGGGDFNLASGAQGLAEGTITYNVVGWEPAVTRDGDNLTIRQGEIEGIKGIPTGDIKNTWDIKLTDAKALDLVVEAGAYKGNLDLSDLRLTKLKIADGASESKVTFNVPNPEKMDSLTYTTGASKVDLIGLSNANFSEMTFQGGAGSYTLDFTGVLAQDATVTIKAGVCNMHLIIPDGTHAVIKNNGGVTSIDTKGSWSVENNVYATPGDGPTLTITVDMGVGSLELERQ